MNQTLSLRRTALHGAHLRQGARMVPFAGYDMPVQYREGVLAEHRWTRASAGLFDVSHMGGAFLTLNRPTGDGEADHRAVAAIVESLTCGDIAGLGRGRLRYTLLLNDQGGTLDDLMVSRPVEGGRQGQLLLVVNAGTKDQDFDRFEAAAGGAASLTRLEDWGLLALQGPLAAAALEPILAGVSGLTFMGGDRFQFGGRDIYVSRSGYTGDDGFEILLPGDLAEILWDRLLADERVRPIGLGARDSLRLEAGLPLYGHDLDETVSPIEAGLDFAVAKRRRLTGDFPGAGRILVELDKGPHRVRVALRVLEGAPAREGAEIATPDGQVAGRVTSGGFSPTLSAPIAMGFVPPVLSAPGQSLTVIVRGKAQAAEVVALPFVPHRYVRKP